MPRKVSDYRNPKDDADWNGVLTGSSRNRMTGTDASIADWGTDSEKGGMSERALSISGHSRPPRSRPAEGA